MPVYTIEHSYPLTTAQKSRLAKAITTLHSVTFLTPSLYVNVRFLSAEAAGDYYVAGEPILPQSPNRIMGLVRTSPRRSKECFDWLAIQFENIWYDVVNGDAFDDPVLVAAEKGIYQGGVLTGVVPGINDGKPAHVKLPTGTAEEKKLKKLHIIVFMPQIGSRENGVAIPSADNEGTWLIDNLEYFKKQAANGDEQFAAMLKELDARPDLKKLTLPN